MITTVGLAFLGGALITAGFLWGEPALVVGGIVMYGLVLFTALRWAYRGRRRP